MRVVLHIQDDGLEEEELLELIEETLAEEGIVAVAHMEEDE
jgi:hypothetical protein